MQKSKSTYTCRICKSHGITQRRKFHICPFGIPYSEEKKRAFLLRLERDVYKKRHRKEFKRKTSLTGLKQYKCSKCCEIKGKKHSCGVKELKDVKKNI